MKKNYQAWNLDPNQSTNNFSPTQKLELLVKYSVLSPSAHNSQPWQFILLKDKLLLKINDSRQLEHSAKITAEPYLSLGACLGTLEMAAIGLGLEVKIKRVLTKDVVAEISLVSEKQPKADNLRAIINRSTNRNGFINKDIPAKILNKFNSFSDQKAKIITITGHSNLEYLSKLTYDATTSILKSKDFKDELSAWVRNNYTNKFDGMPGFTQGIPGLPSLVAKGIIKYADISKTQADKDSQLVINSSAILIISVSKTSQLNYLAAGSVYSKISIEAERLGLSSSGIGATTSLPKNKQLLNKNFGTGEHPVCMIRLGYSEINPKHTPRWPATNLGDTLIKQL